MRFLLKSGAKIEVCPEISKYFGTFFHIRYISYICNNQIIILLAALHQQIFVIQQVSSCNQPDRKQPVFLCSKRRRRPAPACAFRLSTQIQPHCLRTDRLPSHRQPAHHGIPQTEEHPQTQPAKYLRPTFSTPPMWHCRTRMLDASTAAL